MATENDSSNGSNNFIYEVDDDGDWDDECCSDDGSSRLSCSSCSTTEADQPAPAAARRNLLSPSSSVAAAATAFDPLDARRLPDLLDPERLVLALDGCLQSGYVRGCVVETWDSVLSDHLDAIAHLVLYQTPELSVSQSVYEKLTALSTALRPKEPAAFAAPSQRQPGRLDAELVYRTLRSAARSLLATRVDACCRQSMCRAVGLAVAALRANTRPVFSVENFLVEINEAADFANLYCTEYAKRICAALTGIYDAVMAGEYHPSNVVVQMAVMEKCIRAALRTLADARATGEQKAAAQRALLAELDDVCATVRMKNYGCLDSAAAVVGDVRPDGSAAMARPVHFTMSAWRAPIRMYHQQSSVSVDQLLKTTVRLVEALVSEIFKPCLSNHRQNRRRNGQRWPHDKQP